MNEFSISISLYLFRLKFSFFLVIQFFITVFTPNYLLTYLLVMLFHRQYFYYLRLMLFLVDPIVISVRIFATDRLVSLVIGLQTKNHRIKIVSKNDKESRQMRS